MKNLSKKQNDFDFSELKKNKTNSSNNVLKTIKEIHVEKNKKIVQKNKKIIKKMKDKGLLK